MAEVADWASKARQDLDASEVRAAFKAMDSDENGKIEGKEFDSELE